jgi:hypothetical protein
VQTHCHLPLVARPSGHWTESSHVLLQQQPPTALPAGTCNCMCHTTVAHSIGLYCGINYRASQTVVDFSRKPTDSELLFSDRRIHKLRASSKIRRIGSLPPGLFKPAISLHTYSTPKATQMAQPSGSAALTLLTGALLAALLLLPPRALAQPQGGAGWRKGRATYFSGPDYFTSAFDAARGVGSFGILEKVGLAACHQKLGYWLIIMGYGRQKHHANLGTGTSVRRWLSARMRVRTRGVRLRSQVQRPLVGWCKIVERAAA